MKPTFTLTTALVAVALATSAHAQPAAGSSAGLLGQRYAELSGAVLDPHSSSDYGYEADLSVNVPVQAGLDVGFGYGYSRLNADFFSGLLEARSRTHTAYTTATAYRNFNSVKPFLGAALGYQWSKDRLRFGGATVLDEREDEGVWGLGAGVEIPLGGCTVRPAITYQDGFKSDSAAGFTYGAEVHRWFTSKVGGFVDATFADPTGGGTQSWTYRVGARLRF